MKNLVSSLFLFIFYNGFSQHPIFEIDNFDAFDFPNSYRKDTRNELDKFVGTWKYEDTRTTKSFTIILKKAVQVYGDYPDSSLYEDIIYGDYKYFAFGMEVINTLPNLTNSSMNSYDHSIVGNIIYLPFRHPVCSDCAPSERRLNLVFIDSERSYMSAFILLRHRIVFGVEKLEALVYARGSILPDDDSPTNLRVPYGEYTLKKVQ